MATMAPLPKLNAPELFNVWCDAALSTLYVPLPQLFVATAPPVVPKDRPVMALHDPPTVSVSFAAAVTEFDWNTKPRTRSLITGVVPVVVADAAVVVPDMFDPAVLRGVAVTPEYSVKAAAFCVIAVSNVIV